jgi:hemolysin III
LKQKSPKLTFIEEVANAVTHGLGALLSIAALVIMVVFAARDGDSLKIVSASIFGASLILLYSSSTFYHASPPSLKEFSQKIDHSAIYLLIAGTYTPFTLVTLSGAWGWWVFGIIWFLAVCGIIFQVFFYSDRLRIISTIIYLLMGWMVIVAIKPLVNNMELNGLWWLLAGGLSYSGGVAFYLWKKLPFAHSIWHLFVLGGSICHFFAVLFFVI